MIRSKTARANAGSQSARLCKFKMKNFNVSKESEKSSSAIRVLTVRLIWPSVKNYRKYSVLSLTR